MTSLLKLKSVKKVSFNKEKQKLKLWQLESLEPLEILESKLIEKLPTLIQASEEIFVNLT